MNANNSVNLSKVLRVMCDARVLDSQAPLPPEGCRKLPSYAGLEY